MLQASPKPVNKPLASKPQSGKRKFSGGNRPLSPSQKALAWKFQHTSPTMKSMQDAAKCLSECFALMRGTITEAQFTAETGHAPHGIRSAKSPANTSPD